MTRRLTPAKAVALGAVAFWLAAVLLPLPPDSPAALRQLQRLLREAALLTSPAGYELGQLVDPWPAPP